MNEACTHVCMMYVAHALLFRVLMSLHLEYKFDCIEERNELNDNLAVETRYHDKRLKACLFSSFSCH